MFGLIYFVLFIIPVALNEQNAFLKFPKLDDGFQQKMVIDMGLGVCIGLLVVLLSWVLTKFTKVFQELVEALNDLIGPLTMLEIFFIAAFSSSEPLPSTSPTAIAGPWVESMWGMSCSWSKSMWSFKHPLSASKGHCNPFQSACFFTRNCRPIGPGLSA